MNILYLLNFIQIVEWGNISKAAAFLNIAQSALSRQIKSLEDTLGTQLLRRQSWGVEPTEDGKMLLEHARRIQKECIDAKESIQSNKDNPVGTVYLGVPSAYSVSLVPPLLHRMRALYPNVSVQVVEAFSGTIYEWLVSGRLDMAILYHSKEHSAAVMSPFIEEDMVALGTAEMLGDKAEIQITDLARKKLISAWRPHLHRLTLDAAFVSADVPFEPLIEIDSLPCMIELAHRGEGVAILPPSCVVRELNDGRLKAAPLLPNVKLTTVLGQTPNKHPTRAMTILTNMLQNLAAELAPKTGWKITKARLDAPA
ncbi:LysR family transcriptional regulator [Antarcticimicrobium sediminis]|uniref:LysR family transcriptional regulator n=1 Tax=Antarcticimicrobium sediminis TaxID=2546227 RepID=A0A4R5F0X5_9RHOB|nr:LysR family transcriptional regulator [Antarcticimicrobium sediminis]TDE41148.1 LysR family transcriptional regulator [Antarcticimicrobium sediminis]